jgi:hypothetical protein
METLGGVWIYALEPENCLAGTTKISFKFGLLSKGYCSLSLNVSVVQSNDFVLSTSVVHFSCFRSPTAARPASLD